MVICSMCVPRLSVRGGWDHGHVEDLLPQALPQFRESPGGQVLFLQDNDTAVTDRQEQILVVACTEAADTGLDDAFRENAGFAYRGSIVEPDVDESLRGYGGIRCSVYEPRR